MRRTRTNGIEAHNAIGLDEYKDATTASTKPSNRGLVLPLVQDSSSPRDGSSVMRCKAGRKRKERGGGRGGECTGGESALWEE